MDQQIEQTTEQEQTPGEATREELIAAVREAGGTESVDVAAEEAAAAERAQQPAGTQQQAEDSQEAKLERILKAREESHKKRLEADDYIARQRQEAETERQRIVEEARAEARRIASEELESERAKWRSSPTATARALAGDTQEFVDSIIRDGTPEARAIAKAQEEARLAREEAKQGGEAKKALDKFLSDQAAEKETQRVAAIQESFISQHAPKEKAPYLYASVRGNSSRVFSECNDLCKEWQADGLVLGKDFDRDTLVAYLERQSRKAFEEASGTPAQQSGTGAPAKEPGNAPKSVANGPRTLSAAHGSERRTSPKPLSEMTADQQRAALIEEVAAARRANPDATS